MSNPIHLVLASDNNYAQHLGVSIISILENNNSKSNLVFHILENGIDEGNRKKLEVIRDKYNCQITFYNINDSKTDGFPELGHLSKATYLRLFIPEILPPEIKKVIYLDCDLVVLDDLSELYNTDLGDMPIAAVTDVKAEEITRIYFYPGLSSYFNAGVLLIDIEKWRNMNLSKEAALFINKYKDELTTADQDALNCLFNNNWKQIDSRYNVDLKHKKINAIPPKDTVVLHYSDKVKPWSYLYTGKNKKYYFEYLKLSPWKDFGYKDKSTKNFFRKYRLAILKELKNILRPISPKRLIDWNKRRFIKRLQVK